jgi:hypothetical protein
MKVHRIKQRASISLRRLLNQAGMREEKIFAVGFNKSGTSSLHALFKSLGRLSYHGTKWRGCDDLELLQLYDCFSDGIPKDLAKLDRLFPGSKFILQLRDLESWIYSRLAHIERNKKAKTYKAHPAWDTTEHAIKAWVRARNAHHLFVLSYFSERPSDILVVNFIRDESAASRICRFLGYEGECQRPKWNINPSKERPLKHTEMLGRCIAELGIPERELEYDIYCPSIESSEVHSRFPVDSSKLLKRNE